MLLLRHCAEVAAKASWQSARLNATVVMMLFENMLADWYFVVNDDRNAGAVQNKSLLLRNAERPPRAGR